MSVTREQMVEILEAFHKVLTVVEKRLTAISHNKDDRIQLLPTIGHGHFSFEQEKR
jgi:hypothetical protein